MTKGPRSTSDDVLPIPREALVELGLTDADIQLAIESAPDVVAFQADEAPGATFSVDHVRHVLAALGEFRHTKGRWARRRILLGEGLDAWQVVWIIAPIFGWVRWSDDADRWVRVIDNAWIEIPRKNGKSTICAAIGNVLLLADGEMGAEVYSAAGSTTQAARIGDDMKAMCLTSRHVRGKVKPLANLIRVPATGSMFRVLSRVADTAHGLNVHGGVIDEIHTLKLRAALIEAIETGTGARDQPLIVYITTADEDESGTPYDQQHTLVVNVADRVVTGPAGWSTYGVIWRASADDDPWDPETWLKANPGTRAGASPTMDYLEKQAAKAKASPGKVPGFLRLHLNIRSRDVAKWLSPTLWDTAGQVLDAGTLGGQPAYMGLDLSAVSDFSALWVGVVDDQAHRWLWHFWVPETKVKALEKQLQIPLQRWIDDGWVVATEGDAIDYGVVEDRIVEWCRRLDVQRLSYDRMFAGQLTQRVVERTSLDADHVVPVAQTYLGLSPAMKETERLLRVNVTEMSAGRQPVVNHGGNPVARWMALNTEVLRDQQDNMKPIKPNRDEASTRIDGVAAMVMGMDGYVRREIAATAVWDTA